LNLSQNALKLAYTNVEFKKTDIPDLRFKGEKGMEGAGGMAERRRKAGRWKATGIAHPLISA